ncbi:MAG: cation:proton antiporter [Methyloversatilis sp.]|uniref:cation:proton antiporter domain-containing protein n=1 Tax=Methyloversatilis sp. TaxID=2569862 RepID=UPI0027339FC1|nr:cation:proton antiporter [Methyloversatilis sp.]MDP3874535.1 cation:proton antiporter [Methyloversatilis sp.]
MDAHAGLPHLQPLLLFLAIAGLVMPLLARARVSQVVAFLCAGALVGPYGLGRLAADQPWLGALTIADGEGVRGLAELGVMFMLFVIGLELSARQLWSLRRWVLGVGSAQWLGTGALIAGIALAFGHGHETALVLGLGLAMSSTAVVMQLLDEAGQTRSTVGRTSFAVLLLQDIAFVPLLILLGLMAGDGAGGTASGFVWLLLTALAKAALAVALILLLGRVVLTPLFRRVSVTTQADSFMALTLLAALGVAALTGRAGLSMALGAFLAGLMLSETEYRHAALQAIEPFKGLLMGLFFVSVGMSLDLITVAADALWLVGSVIGLYALKSAVLFTLFRLFGLARGDAAEAALLLGQAGEFALIVIGIALGTGLLDSRTGNFMLLVATLSMFMTPLAAKAGRALHRRFDRAADTADEGAAARSLPAQDDVVIIAGFGRVGQRVARVLDRAGLPWVAIERHVAAATRHHAEGRTVIVGDAGSPSLLHHLGAGRARALVVTMDDPAAARHVVRSLHAEFPALPLIARARDGAHAAELRAVGASEVIPEALEAALQLGDHVLAQLDVSPARRGELIDAERRSAD